MKNKGKKDEGFKQNFTSNAALCTSFYKSCKNDESLLLVPRLVHQQKLILFGHINYMTSDQHMGNSTVLYCIVETDGNVQRRTVYQVKLRFGLRSSKSKTWHLPIKQNITLKLGLIYEPRWCHGATWELPQGCFGIKKKTLVVVDLRKKVRNYMLVLFMRFLMTLLLSLNDLYYNIAGTQPAEFALVFKTVGL
ncbi:hypothetical protein VP01_94g7 [Puccinia sorghi]|uniref:Uncharacterized protein n=1 Tax=Puccinia sorghi TaxID=27349 RepID=A0A0L6U8J5_9BASI|nr:hypothetical protein VP01_94g7 [Puccinia sorghi]